MARYRGPRVKIVRRLGELPGLTTKVPNRTYGPGQHGQATSTGKLTQFRVRLQEKQKLRYNYGISEKQLLTYVRRARRAKGPTGEVLLQMLEMRLDSIVYRLGFAPTIRAARQYVSHGKQFQSPAPGNYRRLRRGAAGVCNASAKPGSGRIGRTDWQTATPPDHGYG